MPNTKQAFLNLLSCWRNLDQVTIEIAQSDAIEQIQDATCQAAVNKVLFGEQAELKDLFQNLDITITEQSDHEYSKVITSIMNLFSQRLEPFDSGTSLNINSPIAQKVSIKNLQHKLKIAEKEAVDYKQQLQKVQEELNEQSKKFNNYMAEYQRQLAEAQNFQLNQQMDSSRSTILTLQQQIDQVKAQDQKVMKEREEMFSKEFQEAMNDFAKAEAEYVRQINELNNSRQISSAKHEQQVMELKQQLKDLFCSFDNSVLKYKNLFATLQVDEDQLETINFEVVQLNASIIENEQQAQQTWNASNSQYVQLYQQHQLSVDNILSQLSLISLNNQAQVFGFQQLLSDIYQFCNDLILRYKNLITNVLLKGDQNVNIFENQIQNIQKEIANCENTIQDAVESAKQKDQSMLQNQILLHQSLIVNYKQQCDKINSNEAEIQEQALAMSYLNQNLIDSLNSLESVKQQLSDEQHQKQYLTETKDQVIEQLSSQLQDQIQQLEQQNQQQQIVLQEQQIQFQNQLQQLRVQFEVKNHEQKEIIQVLQNQVDIENRNCQAMLFQSKKQTHELFDVFDDSINKYQKMQLQILKLNDETNLKALDQQLQYVQNILVEIAKAIVTQDQQTEAKVQKQLLQSLEQFDQNATGNLVLQQKLEQRQEQLREIAQNNQNLTEKLKILQDEHLDLQEIQFNQGIEMQGAKAELERLQQLIKELKEQKSSFKQNSDKLQNQLQENQQQMTEQGSLIGQLKEMMTALDQENISHQDVIKKLKSELNRNNNNLQKLNEDLQNARNKVEVVELQSNDKRAIIEKQQQDMDFIKQKVIEKGQQLLEAHEKQLKQTQQHQDLLDNVEKVQDKLQIRLLDGNNNFITENLHLLNSDIRTMDNNIKQLQQQIQQSEEKQIDQDLVIQQLIQDNAKLSDFRSKMKQAIDCLEQKYKLHLYDEENQTINFQPLLQQIADQKEKTMLQQQEQKFTRQQQELAQMAEKLRFLQREHNVAQKRLSKIEGRNRGQGAAMLDEVDPEFDEGSDWENNILAFHVIEVEIGKVFEDGYLQQVSAGNPYVDVMLEVDQLNDLARGIEKYVPGIDVRGGDILQQVQDQFQSLELEKRMLKDENKRLRDEMEQTSEARQLELIKIKKRLCDLEQQKLLADMDPNVLEIDIEKLQNFGVDYLQHLNAQSSLLEFQLNTPTKYKASQNNRQEFQQSRNSQAEIVKISQINEDSATLQQVVQRLFPDLINISASELPRRLFNLIQQQKSDTRQKEQSQTIEQNVVRSRELLESMQRAGSLTKRAGSQTLRAESTQTYMRKQYQFQIEALKEVIKQKNQEIADLQLCLGSLTNTQNIENRLLREGTPKLKQSVEVSKSKLGGYNELLISNFE